MFKGAVLSFLLSTLLIANAYSWTDPVLVDVTRKVGSQETSGFTSPDNLTFYFARKNNPSYDYWQLYKATRNSTSEAFSNATYVNMSNSNHVWGGWVSPDNLRMYYSTTGGSYTIRMATRANANDAWTPGASLGGAFSSLVNYDNPHLTPDELTMAFHSHLGIGASDLYIATRASKNDAWGNIRNLSELNTSGEDVFACVTPDALTMYFASSRNGSWQVFTASRDSVLSQFSAPVLMPQFNGYLLNNISNNGRELYLTGPGYDGIYVSYIPEPCTVSLVGLGLVGLLRRRGK